MRTCMPGIRVKGSELCSGDCWQASGLGLPPGWPGRAPRTLESRRLPESLRSRAGVQRGGRPGCAFSGPRARGTSGGAQPVSPQHRHSHARSVATWHGPCARTPEPPALPPAVACHPRATAGRGVRRRHAAPVARTRPLETAPDRTRPHPTATGLNRSQPATHAPSNVRSKPGPEIRDPARSAPASAHRFPRAS
jgi:hypothetical protein